jgi:uracil-DNA glycosylase family 4
MRELCPVCHDNIVPAYGDEHSDILLVGEYPGMEEMRRGYPFTGRTGDVLSSELSRCGINMWSVRLTNLWQHDPTKDDGCFKYFLRDLLAEMAGRKVLMMGRLMSTYFLHMNILDVSGMEMTSPLFPRSIQFVMFSPNPALCFHAPIGEFRLAIQKFVKKCKGE